MTTAPSFPVLAKVIDLLAARNPKLGHRARAFAAKQNVDYKARAEAFFVRFANLLEETGYPLSDGIDSFLHLHEIIETERDFFLAHDKYRNSSFEEVNRNFYGNPERMRRHMHGLVLAQFLWPDQYHRFKFFSEGLLNFGPRIKTYLEVGGGHALYATEAAMVLGSNARIDLVDISPTSMQMAQSIARGFPIHFHLMDILDFPNTAVYDFITMGEILEHVEEPEKLLLKMRALLRTGGMAFVSTPANSPMPDHIFMFRNAEEIRALIRRAGFRIIEETSQYSVDCASDLAERLKLSLMYAAFIQPTD